ncbi:alpha/beta fold hydrolase [Paludisphaera borealis]|uniref:Pimeloyl-[acyl-carrier protein] methyl ester esterase n=1 Tax=Paludisphaera borealis TaxID=1387353 RepID=A0A1U7CQR2_9BACT|nr:alpha/beta hydrolase [Paludisphaera borealis]APW61239.1 Pimeloyl-[acyl-carrier protein] methyl ester esterase [Paludisphaera borealis]
MRLSTKWRDTWSTIASDVDSRRSERVTIEGDVFDVVRMGRGEPLVLVPGLAGSWKLLMPLARRLAREYEVVSYSLRGDRSRGRGGPGDSRRRHVDVGGHADDLAALIDRLGMECPAVFGVSFGAAVALELAVEQPGCLGSLIVQGIEERFRTTIGSTIAQHVLERYPLPANSPFLNQFLNLLYGTKPEPGPRTDFVVDRIWETPQAVMAERLRQLRQFDVADRLWRIDVPTLVLAGSKDAIIPASRQKRLAQGISGARFESIEGAGHIGFVTHADAVVRQVHDHFQRVKASV